MSPLKRSRPRQRRRLMLAPAPVLQPRGRQAPRLTQQAQVAHQQAGRGRRPQRRSPGHLRQRTCLRGRCCAPRGPPPAAAQRARGVAVARALLWSPRKSQSQRCCLAASESPLQTGGRACCGCGAAKSGHTSAPYGQGESSGAPGQVVSASPRQKAQTRGSARSGVTSSHTHAPGRLRPGPGA